MAAPQILVAGGGIGALACAVAASRAGCELRVFERAAEFTEVGAGIQLGPNATRVLQGWGLGPALAAVAAFPSRLAVHGAHDGELLAALPLADGDAMRRRYGAPYATVHRADLHGLLLDAARAHPGVRLCAGTAVLRVEQGVDSARLRTACDRDVEGDALIGADGVWSTVRQQAWRDGAPRFAGQLAWRGLVAQTALPAAQRSDQVRVWLGPRLHVVAYPVRRGEWLNVVAIADGGLPSGDPQDWDHAAAARDLQTALRDAHPTLRAVVDAVPSWRLWALHGRAPVAGPAEMASGRIALLGDAAHPMVPYLAQGAAMAIEDAHMLGGLLAQRDADLLDLPTALTRYALNRWQRCARVQRRATRNGRVFHADGVLRVGRDAALRLLGARLLDQPWLYGA